jgi:hypothetical protein
MWVFSHYQSYDEWVRRPGWFGDTWEHYCVSQPMYVWVPDPAPPVWIEYTQHHYVEQRPTHEERRREELAQMRHKIAVTELATRLVRAQAELHAECDLAYQIAVERRGGILLELRMETAERRAVLNQHTAEVNAPKQLTDGRNQRVVDDALYDARAKLRAHGVEAPLLDAVVEERNRRR